MCGLTKTPSGGDCTAACRPENTYVMDTSGCLLMGPAQATPCSLLLHRNPPACFSTATVMASSVSKCSQLVFLLWLDFLFPSMIIFLYCWGRFAYQLEYLPCACPLTTTEYSPPYYTTRWSGTLLQCADYSAPSAGEDLVACVVHSCCYFPMTLSHITDSYL